MLIEIKHRYTQNVIYACEAKSWREAVLEAFSRRIDLSSAELKGVDLSGAYLSGADLSSAHLGGANLSGAHLGGANLSGANIIGANFSGADLRGVDLSGAYLSGGSGFIGANLIGANLSGEKLASSPISILNLYWSVLITESYLTIGCQRHTHAEWKAFSMEDITKMHDKASEFWTANKSWILFACKEHRKESLAFRKANPTEITE